MDFVDRLANKNIYVATKVDEHHPVVPISSVIIQGLSASSVVIDEFFDLLGKIITAGDLKQLTLGLANSKKITTLSPHVFDVLSDKCTELKNFELYNTDVIEALEPRKVLHDFFGDVIAKCDKNKLEQM